MKDNKLEVGDVMYQTQKWTNGYQKHKIVRLTPTTAIADTGRRYKINLAPGWGGKGFEASVIGSYGNDQIESPELISEQRLAELKIKVTSLVDKFKASQLNEDQLNSVYQFMKPLCTL